jgi:hypothetical protein
MWLESGAGYNNSGQHAARDLHAQQQLQHPSTGTIARPIMKAAALDQNSTHQPPS